MQHSFPPGVYYAAVAILVISLTVLVWRKGWRALSLVPLGVFAVLTFIQVKTRFEYSAMLHQTLMFVCAEAMILMGIIGPTKRLDSKN
jgi:hypothetical protein